MAMVGVGGTKDELAPLSFDDTARRLPLLPGQAQARAAVLACLSATPRRTSF